MRDHLDPVLGRALEDVYTELVGADQHAPGTRGTPARSGSRARTVWVTAVVAVVVVLVAALVIHAGRQTARPAIAPTSDAPMIDRSVLLQKLPKQPHGRTVHTWTDRDTTDTAGPFPLSGSTAVIAAVCDGGGAIQITDARGSKHKETCTRLDVQQPFWRFDLGGDGKATEEDRPVSIRVTVLSGTPRYIVRLWSVDPRILDADTWTIAATSATVPRTLRTCAAQDLAPTAAIDWQPGRSSGIVTLTGRGTTDCAIRSWPAMRYLAANGSQIGPAQGVTENGRSVDSREGAVDEYGEFPPARLAAGGKAYLILDLSTEAQLRQEDADQKTMPTPTTGPAFTPTPCEPERVAAIRLDIGGATVTVPVPTSRAPAACRTAERSFGVNPVVPTRPAGR